MKDIIEFQEYIRLREKEKKRIKKEVSGVNIGVWKIKDEKRDDWIRIMERRYGIKVSGFRYASRDHYLAYIYSVDGEIIGLWDVKKEFPYKKVEARILNERYEIKEILGEV